MLKATKDLRRGDVVEMDEEYYQVYRVEGDVVHWLDGSQMEGDGTGEPLWEVVPRQE